MKNLSTVSAILAAAVSAAGIFTPIYKDIPWAAGQMRGQDGVTIIASVILFLSSRIKTGGREIIRAGINAYLIYTYLFYALETVMNPLFHLYLIIVLTSGISLIKDISFLNKNDTIPAGGKGAIPGLLYLTLTGLMLFVLWNGDIITTLAGSPLLPNPSGEPLTIVYVFDLTFVIPAIVYTLYLWKKGKPFGNPMLGIMLIKAATMGTALLGMTLGMWLSGFELDTFLTGLWGFVGGAGIITLMIFLRSIRTAGKTDEQTV